MLSAEEVDQMCQSVRRILEETDPQVCVSFGLLSGEQFRKLKEAGVTRDHNNLESSKKFFPGLCTSHRFEDKVKAIKAAKMQG